jgi:hypothetical protein
MTVKHTMPEQAPIAAETAPICVACVGDRTNPDGGPCLRCKGTGTDPDPLAPTGIAVAS